MNEQLPQLTQQQIALLDRLTEAGLSDQQLDVCYAMLLHGGVSTKQIQYSLTLIGLNLRLNVIDKRFASIHHRAGIKRAELIAMIRAARDE